MAVRSTIKKQSKVKNKPGPSGKGGTRTRGRPGTDQKTVGPEALVDATLAMLSSHAPSEITRASLARYANVDPGLIRYYFSDRDSLMRTAAQVLTERLQTRGQAATERTDLSPPERIEERMKALLDFKLENPFYHRVVIEEVARSGDDSSRELYNRIADTAIARYQGYLAEGADDGSLRQVDPAFLYMAIIGLCDFFVTAAPLLADRFEGKSPEATEQAYGAFICDLLMNGLRPR